MENSLIIDTNIFVEHLRIQNKVSSSLFKIAAKYNVFTTSVTEFELYCGAVTLKHKQDLDNVLKYIAILPFDEGCGKIAALERNKLLKLNKQFEIRDLLIAGIVIKNDIPFFTFNVKHFKNFKAIKIVSKDEI